MFEKLIVNYAPRFAAWILIVMGLCLLSTCLTGCASGKAVAIASNGTVVKLETTGSTTSGTIAPNVLLGVVQNSIATAPALKEGEKTQVSIAYTESHSWIAEIFGLTSITRTFSYIGLPGESAEQTKIRLDALEKILTANSKATASK